MNRLGMVYALATMPARARGRYISIHASSAVAWIERPARGRGLSATLSNTGSTVQRTIAAPAGRATAG